VKLTCLPVSFYPDLTSGHLSLGDWFRTAARIGLNGADFSVAHVNSRAPAYLNELRREAADAGVELPMLVTYSDFTHPDARYRADQVDDLRAWIEAGHRLGIAFLRVTAGQAHAGVPEEAGLGWAVEGLSACTADATSAGLRLLYENHTRGSVWQHNDFTQPAARFLEVARRTKDTGLQILFDTANCLPLGDDPGAVLRAVIDRVGAVHLSDIRRAGAFEPTLIGTGVAPLRALLAQLTAHGFDGWVSIEEASRTGLDGFTHAVAVADRLWGEAGGTPRSPARSAPGSVADRGVSPRLPD
jgi:sugar phosphate isomerase/epimerase